MASGPYRGDPVAWVDPESPPGVVFRGQDDRLNVEVRRRLPAIALIATAAGLGLLPFAPGHEPLGGMLVLLAIGDLYLLDRAKLAHFLTTIEITREQRVFTDSWIEHMPARWLEAMTALTGIAATGHASGGAIFRSTRAGAPAVPVHISVQAQGGWEMRLDTIVENRLRRVFDYSYPVW